MSMAAEGPKAARQNPLPAFQVTSPSGSLVNSKDVVITGKWLLIYVNAGSRASEMMLSQLKSDKYADYLDHMVIILGGLKPEELPDWQSKYPDLNGARWFVDPNRATFRALNLHGAPVEIGLQDSSVIWNLNGMPANLDNFHSTLLDWVKAN
jgi:hypothetical protein